jgi:hypothetical protein
MDEYGWSTTDDALAAVVAYHDGHPIQVASTFLSSLDEPETLALLVTPESREAWGDFEAFRGALSREEWGLASFAHAASDAIDVAYTRVVANVSEVYFSDLTRQVRLVGVFTHVWRPEAGFWMIHEFGEPLPSARVPRSSPGIAPSVSP